MNGRRLTACPSWNVRAITPSFGATKSVLFPGGRKAREFSACHGTTHTVRDVDQDGQVRQVRHAGSGE
eukprot:8333981-Pyramimonas_sp.AAC.1